VTVADIWALYIHDADDQNLLPRAAAVPGLPEKWRDYFRKRLGQAAGRDVAGDAGGA